LNKVLTSIDSVKIESAKISIAMKSSELLEFVLYALAFARKKPVLSTSPEQSAQLPYETNTLN